MVSQFTVSFALVCLVFLYSSQAKAAPEAARSFKEDFDAATKPINDAFKSVEEQMQSLIQKIEEHPFFKRISDPISEKFNEAKQGFSTAYDKLVTCKQVFQEGPQSAQSDSSSSNQSNHSNKPSQSTTEKSGFHIFN